MRFRFVVVLAVLTGIIIYGSLYPFVFVWLDIPGGPFRKLLSTWRDRNTFGDTLANVLLYIPFGFCGSQSLRAPRLGRVALALTAGIVLSGSMELLQLYDESRWGTLADVRSNATGTLLGTMAGLAYERLWKGCRGLGKRFEYLFLLIGCWAGYRLFPYAPVIDFSKYWHAVRPLLQSSISGVSLCEHAVLWLAIALMLEELCGSALSRVALPTAVCTMLLARILIDGVVLSRSEVVGAGAAAVVWGGWLWRIQAGAPWICALWIANLVVQGLAPFHFAARGGGFVWIPFYSFLEANHWTAVPSFFEKAFLYGTLLWLLRRSGFDHWKSAVLASALVLSISLVRSYIPGRSTEITDVLMLLSMAAIQRITDPALTMSFSALRKSSR